MLQTGCSNTSQISKKNINSNTSLFWRDGRVVEGAPLLREYGPKAHRGFESLSLRHK
jgi:hypothetical protein